MPTNTGAIANLLRPGIEAFWGDYPQYPAQWKEIYSIHYSEKATEYEQELKFTGYSQIIPEGSGTPFDSIGQRSLATYTHKKVGLAIQITEEALEDNLYKNKFPMIQKSLRRSLAQTKEVLGANILNSGFTTYILGDGVSLFNVHPIDGGTVSNYAAITSDLNEASLEAAYIQIQQFKDSAGIISMIQPEKLVVPPQLQYVARRLLGSDYRPGTPNNDINAGKDLNALPKGYVVNQFLTSPTAWFILTNAPEGMKHYIRKGVEIDVYSDFYTNNLLSKALERYCFGVSDFRGIYGNAGA